MTGLKRIRSMRIWVFMLALAPMLWATPASAQDEGGSPETTSTEVIPAPDERYATPWKTMETFLTAMEQFVTSGEKRDLEEAVATCRFEDVDIGAVRQELTTNLYNILNRIGTVKEWHFPPVIDESRYVYFPSDQVDKHARLARLVPGFRIELVRDEIGEWRFSKETMAEVGTRWREWEELDIGAGPKRDVAATLGQRLRQLVPKSLRSGQLLTVEYWQWLMILLVILLGLTLDLLVRSLLKLSWRRVERHRGRKTDRAVLRRAVRPFGLLAAGILWYAMLQVGGLPSFASSALLVAVKVILSIAGVWSAWRLVDLIADVFATKAAQTETKIDDLLVPLVERSVKIFIVAIGLVYIADAFDVPIVPLLSGLGIGGLAVAFAAKDTIENFFGSIAVILDRPFEVGDWIVTGEIEGTVEWMGFRSTRIRTFYNSVVTFPNASLVRATVDNYGRRSFRRYKTMVNLAYSTPPEKIEAFCEGVREIVRQHPFTRKDYYHVWLNEFGAHSLDVLVYIFFEAPDWSVELRERQRFMLDVIRLADRLGVEFAFPTQTIHLFKEEHGREHTPMPSPDHDAEMRAIREGVLAARELTGDQPWQEIKPGGVVFGSSPSPTGAPGAILGDAMGDAAGEDGDGGR